MRARLARLLDEIAIRAAASKMPKPDGNGGRLAEALELISSPDFVPAEIEPARVEFLGGNRFQFDTPHLTPWEKNNRVLGRLYRCGERWHEKPVIILSHGWNDIINHYCRYPIFARQINRHGFNAVTLEAPFHFQRRPRELGAAGNFLSPDILRTAQAIRQAIAETRACARWLRRSGCPAVGLMGISLGGWLGGLTICHDSGFDCAALLEPVARLDRLVGEVRFCESLRPAWAGQKITVGKLKLTENLPAIPKKNILLIESIYDLFVPPDTMEELWKAWGEPEMWRMKHGHISVLASPGLNGRIIRWMGPRLNGLAAK